METTKQLRRFLDIRRVTTDGRVYILRRKARIATLRSENPKGQDAKEKEVSR